MLKPAQQKEIKQTYWHCDCGKMEVVGPQKIKVIAWSFSKSAEEKIKKMKGEAILIKDEIKKNPKLTGVKLI